MKLRLFFLSSVICTLLLSSCGGSQSKAENAPTLSVQQVEQLKHGVFQVIIPRTEHSDIEYTEKLPTHLLPYHIRTDRYSVIGTAFSLDGKNLVSAAHVFPLYRLGPVSYTHLTLPTILLV